ncbi:MAG TPA: TonB-dependent receptor [Steroidobacteraceae bacterium]|nr:TonB-dependent receptor [Steroidobacteraceae bacterium]
MHSKCLSIGHARNAHRAAVTATCFTCLALAGPVHADAGGDNSSVEALKKLSVEQLMSVDVTSVSKTAEPLSDAAAAIFVISHDDIVRCGATSIPEILRLAPNLEVFQVSPTDYIITARGFSGNSAAQSFSDKLLVLIDGRSVYTPLYSGVYWDAQTVPIDDIERIEVISGPGATLWGANAVNGVINIITRKSSDTQGELVSVDGGNLAKDAVVQAGAHLDGDASYRLYAQGSTQSALQTPSGSSSGDPWYKTQAGFRSDFGPASNSLTVQGDFYRANETEPGGADVAIAGSNVLTHWQHSVSEDSAVQLLAYYDQTQRFTIGGGAFVLNTYDVEFQQSLELFSWNNIVWGAGERVSRYDITNTASLLFLPDDSSLNLADAFAQDTLALARNLKLILGLKLEDDPYSGMTPLPDVRISWKLATDALIWSAVSRAIRSPTPFDRDVAEYLGGTLFLVGGADFAPEKLTAYEIGFRGQAGSRLSYSVSTYYNDYDDLRSIEFAGNGALLPLHWGNGVEGDTYGVELWGNYQVTEDWRLAFGFDQEHESLRFVPGSSGLLGVSQEGDDPSHQASLRSLLNLTPDLTLDADLRYVGSLPDPLVPAYTDLNARIGWRISSHWQLALSGFNLLHPHHEEFTEPPSDLVVRSVLLSVTLRL